MALSRVKTWGSEVLTYSDLNSEFDNLINNALSLISPLTGNLAAGSNKITGLAAGTASGDAVAVTLNVATQAQQETGTNAVNYVTPSVQQFHPSSVKFWVKAGTTGNILASHNVTSLTDTGTGRLTVTIATDFSSADWACLATIEGITIPTSMAEADALHVAISHVGGATQQAAGTVEVCCYDTTATTVVLRDPTYWHVSGSGDSV